MANDVDLLPRAGARPARAAATRARRRDLTRLALVLVALTLALRVPGFFVPVFNSDETFLATQAHVVADGGNLYHDAIDRKPPLVPYVYAGTFAFFDTTALWSVRLVADAAVALTALLLAVEARRRYGRRAAWLAGILFVCATVAFAPSDGQAANFEIFMLPSMTAAILFARRGRGAAAGVSVALATLAKQTGAATLLPVIYLLARARGKRGVAEGLAGFSVPTVLVALAFGPSQLFYWVVLGNGSYLGMKTLTGYVLLMFTVMTFAYAACNLPVIWRIRCAWQARRTPNRDGDHDLDLWLWLVSAAVSVAVGLRFFGHYYMQLTPPLALLSAGAIARGGRALVRTSAAVAVALAALFTASGFFLHPFGQEPSYQSVARYLASTANPDDQIYVWGSVPEIYWASGLRPATRFLTSSFLTGAYPGRPPDQPNPGADTKRAWAEFYEDFRAHPPKYFVDTSPAKLRGQQYYPVSKFPRLARIVHDQYRYVLSIDEMAIYVRK
jgi:4-amino-4-deoxy-L-arabinose transferase-like glycosyltransferase